MSSPIDPHDPRLDSQRQDELTLMALGEPGDDPEFVAHYAGCARCQDEAQALRRTVELARSAARYPSLASPPDTLWNQIAEAVARNEPADIPADLPASVPAGRRLTGTATPRGTVTELRRKPRRRRVALAVAAAVLVAAGGGYGLGRLHSPTSSTVTATASLAPQPGGPDAVSGTAKIVRRDNDLSLTVETADLPYWQGYYAVWVFDPQANKMINVGTLDSSGRGTFSLPAGVDVRSYDVIDVSAQKFDGNAAHEQSVLRGGLTQ